MNHDGAKHLTVYASWNGSTEIASWQVLRGWGRSELVSIVATPRTGSKRGIGVATSASYVAARALDASGTLLATSPEVKV